LLFYALPAAIPLAAGVLLVAVQADASRETTLEEGTEVYVSPDVEARLVGIRGSRLEDGRLFVDVLGERLDGSTFFRRCYFDAAITLKDGEVGQVVSADSAGRVLTGMRVEWVPSGLDTAEETISGPAYVDDKGIVQAGYSECEDIAE
jgi:hypothetical protein